MKPLSPTRLTALLQERARLLRELSSLSALLHGSFLQRFSTCSRPRCACHQGQRHGPRTYLVVVRDRAQRQVYIPQARIAAVRAGVGQSHRLGEIVERITAINLQLLKGGTFDESFPGRTAGPDPETDGSGA